MRRLLLALVPLLLFTLPAAAREYRVPILVDTEDDVLELYYAGDISEEERDLLLRLLEDPLDINEAGREALYDLPDLTYDLVDAILAARKEKRFARVASLKSVPGITPAIFRQLEPFVKHVPARKAPKPGAGKDVKASFSLTAADGITQGDTDLPELALRGRAQGFGGFKAGFALSLQNGVGPVTWKDAFAGDPAADIWKVKFPTGQLQCDEGAGPYNCRRGESRNAVLEDDPLDRYLRTDGEHYRMPWPKIYVAAARDRWKVLAGSYMIGFGQRLVLDNTGQDKPHGFVPDNTLYSDEEGVRLTPRFMGVAGSYDIGLGGSMSLEVTPFFSWWKYDAYQIYLNHEDDLTGERESYVVVSRVKGTPYYRKHYFVTLPEAYDELLGGGNVAFRWGSRSHVGLTGYGAAVGFHLGDSDTTFTPSSRFPGNRTSFGAFGADVAVEIGADATIYAELAATDRLSGEALAAVLRGVWDRKPLEIDLSARYLGDGFDNPHARGISMSDQWMGSTDRGEIGVRLDLSWKVAKWMRLRVGEDVWRATRWADGDSETDAVVHQWRNDTFFRVDGYPFDWWTMGAFFLLRDNDLEGAGWTWTDRDGDLKGVDYAFNGMKYQAGAQTSFIPLKWLRLDLYYKISFYHAAKLSMEETLQKGHYGTFKIRAKPLSWLVLTGRAKYYKGELETEEEGAAGGEEYAEGYLQVEFIPLKGLAFGGRGAMRHYFHENADGVVPGEEWFWRASVEYSF